MKSSRRALDAVGSVGHWQRIVTESYGGPRLVSLTARRNGLSMSQLLTWMDTIFDVAFNINGNVLVQLHSKAEPFRRFPDPDSRLELPLQPVEPKVYR